MYPAFCQGSRKITIVVQWRLQPAECTHPQHVMNTHVQLAALWLIQQRPVLAAMSVLAPACYWLSLLSYQLRLLAIPECLANVFPQLTALTAVWAWCCKPWQHNFHVCLCLTGCKCAYPKAQAMQSGSALCRS